MTKSEIKTAEKLLAERLDRTEVIVSDTKGGLSLTVYFTDGGQKVFHTLDQIKAFIADRTRS